MPAALDPKGAIATMLGIVAVAACGQKGPPLPPLHLVPAAATEVSARRVADQVRLRFVLPNANANGAGPVEMDRVEIYAITVPPGVVPANRMLLAKENLVGQIAVRPPLAEGEEPKEGDTRPAAGAVAFFDDELTAAKLEPVKLKESELAAAAAAAAGTAVPGTAVPAPGPGTGAAGSTAAAAAPSTPAATGPGEFGSAGLPPGVPGALTITPAPPGSATLVLVVPAAAASKDPTRVYVARGVTKSGRPGAPSARVAVPLVTLPDPPADVVSRVTETAVVLEWKPPAPGAAPLAFNVYRAEDLRQPLNAAPLAEPTFAFAEAQFGSDYCFRVRSVLVAKDAAVEGDPSAESCVTPRDTFPPAAPSRPDAVATAGQINLIWDPSTEKDLAGYLVLRGEAPEGALQPLTPSPIKDARYSDTAVQHGVRYVYVMVAVDGATPANASAHSPRVEETAR